MDNVMRREAEQLYVCDEEVWKQMLPARRLT